MKKWYHLAFLAACAAILVFLLRAPEVTTPRLPSDAVHENRKEFERCPDCHGRSSEHAMPEDHFGPDNVPRPDHLKCYFCHKPTE